MTHFDSFCSTFNSIRHNQRILKLLSDEQEDQQYRHRAGRLDKWRELYSSVQKELELPVAPPERLVRLSCIGSMPVCSQPMSTLHFVVLDCSRIVALGSWLRIGNVVLFRTPTPKPTVEIGRVLTVWKGVRNSRQTTSEVSINSVVAFRAVILTPWSLEDNMFFNSCFMMFHVCSCLFFMYLYDSLCLLDSLWFS